MTLELEVMRRIIWSSQIPISRRRCDTQLEAESCLTRRLIPHRARLQADTESDGNPGEDFEMRTDYSFIQTLDRHAESRFPDIANGRPNIAAINVEQNAMAVW